MVKCAGERVGLEEVAAALRACDGVGDACVVAIPDQALGAKLIAFLETARPEIVPAVRKALRETLTPAKRPAMLVALEALPRMASGKIDRRALQRRAELLS